MLVACAVVFYYIQNYFRSSSRQMKRLASVSSSPVYSTFEEILSGLATVRAFGIQDWLIARN